MVALYRSHAATVQAVAAGVADAGSVDESVFKSLVADGKVDGSSCGCSIRHRPLSITFGSPARTSTARRQKKFAMPFFVLLRQGRQGAEHS